jgi:XrtJ-associated TM-motif-TM protein
MKKTFLLTALVLALAFAVPARAQGGCDDTPENPTLILAGLASGVFAVSNVRTRLRARRATKDAKK